MCLLSFVFTLHRMSSVSVVFDFNASLNDVAPLSPMPFAVNVNREKGDLFMDAFCVSSFVFTTKTDYSELRV